MNNNKKIVYGETRIRLKSNICAKCGKPISYIPTQMNIHLMNCKGK
jgi:hypothetical protein